MKNQHAVIKEPVKELDWRSFGGGVCKKKGTEEDFM